MDRLHAHRIKDQPFDVEIGGEPSEDTASRDSVPIIPALAEILDAYRRSAGNPELGFVFRSSDGLPISLDKVVRRVIRPALEGIGLPWGGWHAFRRGRLEPIRHGSP